MPSTQDIYHEELMSEVADYLELCGYEFYSGDYGTAATLSTREELRGIMTVAATMLRTRADRVAVKEGTVFEFDAKTKQNKCTEIAVEAIPVIYHILMDNWFGLRCVYGFRWAIRPELNDVGFLVNSGFGLLVSSVVIFEWREDMEETNEFVRSKAPEFFPNAEIVVRKSCYGSGDPMVCVPIDAHRKMPHWKTVIDSIFERNMK